MVQEFAKFTEKAQDQKISGVEMVAINLGDKMDPAEKLKNKTIPVIRLYTGPKEFEELEGSLKNYYGFISFFM